MEEEATLTNTDPMLVGQAAKILGWPRMRVYRWVEAGKMVGIKFGGILFIPASEVERLRNKQGEGENNE